MFKHIETHPAVLSSLSANAEVPPLDPWCKLQLSHFPPGPETLCLRIDSVREGVSLRGAVTPHIVLLNAHSHLDPDFLLERDLCMTFSDEQWTRIFTFAHKASIICKYQEIYYKIVTMKVQDALSAG